MHKVIEPKILYFGTPVVLISTLNEDGSSNLAPMSSAWWLNQSCMLGLGGSAKTVENLLRERQGVLNLPSFFLCLPFSCKKAREEESILRARALIVSSQEQKPARKVLAE